MRKTFIAASLAAAFLGTVTGVQAQGLPPGPKVTVSAVTQVAPTVPQYTRVDVPIMRDEAVKKSGGRVEFNLKSWPEMNVQGPEVIRLVRSGQVDLGATPLTTVSGDVPSWTAWISPASTPTLNRRARSRPRCCRSRTRNWNAWA